jgi:hypothetical protein
MDTKMDETLAIEPATLPSAAPTLNPTFGSLLALGVTLEETTVCLLENVSGLYRLAGWSTQPRPAGASLTQPTVAACQQLGRQLGRALWDEEANTPFLQSPDALVYPPLEHVSIGISPQPRLRVWLVGLSSESLRAAHQALSSAPLHISGMTPLRPGLTSPQIATALADHQPEALVVVGGYDSPDPATHGWLLALCRLVGQALARLAPAERPTVFYAGNRWAAAAALPLLQQGAGPLTMEALGNVLPHPHYPVYTELPVALSQLYWRQCQRTPGVAQLSRWATAPGHVASLESSFAQLVQIWMEYHGLPQLHGLYCTSHWWLHVWAEQAAQGVQLRFVKPATRPQGFADWPPLQLVSGPWPVQQWATPTTAWWDRHALAPLITVVGQVAPQAMLQVLEEDILEPRQRRIVAA